MPRHRRVLNAKLNVHLKVVKAMHFMNILLQCKKVLLS